MPNPWDRPEHGPYRTGDYDADKLYLAVGRSLSKWERLEGEIAHLYAITIGGADGAYFNVPAVWAFGTLKSPTSRADMVAAAAEALFHYLAFEPGTNVEELESIEDNLRTITKEYRGWMSRRNDVAHGYVNTREHPDYMQKGEPLTTSHSLYPSDGSSGKWCIIAGEPAHAYRAEDIDRFGDAFQALEENVRTFAERLERYRTERRPKPPPQSPPPHND